MLEKVEIKAGVEAKVYRKLGTAFIPSGKGTLVKLIGESSDKAQLWSVKVKKTKNTPINTPKYVVRFIKNKQVI